MDSHCQYVKFNAKGGEAGLFLIKYQCLHALGDINHYTEIIFCCFLNDKNLAELLVQFSHKALFYR